MRNYVGSMLLVCVFFVLWEIGARWADVPYMLPAPTLIALKLWELRIVLLTVHLPATLQIIAVGLFLSIFWGLV